MNACINISFVIPCYRSENTILFVVDEIEETMKKRQELEYEIILVNDGSPDGVWNVINDRAEKDEHIVGIDLARNFGQHCALMAGYNRARGDIIVSLDDDGQTSAGEVFKLIDKLNEGYDTVYAVYSEYHQSAFRRWGSGFANRMTYSMLNVKEDFPKVSSYFVMRRFVVDEILNYDHPYPYIAGLILRATRNIAFVNIEHRKRMSGKSGYSLKSLYSLWLNGFTAFSVKPLEIGILVGFFLAFCGFLFTVITVIRKMLTPQMQAGWSSTISAIMFIGGVIMIMLGLIGEYIGRIYICLNNSPQYVIRKVVGAGYADDTNNGIYDTSEQ